MNYVEEILEDLYWCQRVTPDSVDDFVPAGDVRGVVDAVSKVLDKVEERVAGTMVAVLEVSGKKEDTTAVCVRLFTDIKEDREHCQKVSIEGKYWRRAGVIEQNADHELFTLFQDPNSLT